MPELSELHDLQAAERAEAEIQRDADNCASDLDVMYGAIATMMGNVSERFHRRGGAVILAHLSEAKATRVSGTIQKVLAAWPLLSHHPAPTFPDLADPPVVESEPEPEVTG